MKRTVTPFDLFHFITNNPPLEKRLRRHLGIDNRPHGLVYDGKTGEIFYQLADDKRPGTPQAVVLYEGDE